VKLSDLKDPVVVSEPKKLSDLKDVEVASKPDEPSVIGLSGPGSKDENPGDVITKPVPTSVGGAAKQVGEGALDSVKSFGRGIKTLSSEASPYNESGAHVPFSGLTDPSKRRELERGVSDVVTLGAAEKLGNVVDPQFAATAKPDAEAAPGYREAGGVAGSALPSVLEVAGQAGKKAFSGAVERAGNKVVDEVATGARPDVRRDLGEKREIINKIAKEDKSAIKKPSDPASLLESSQEAITKRMNQNDALYAAHDVKSPGVGVSIGEMREKILDAADKAAKNPSTVDTVAPKLRKLADNVMAFGDPGEFVSSRQARQLATDWQKVAMSGAEGAEENVTQEAHRHAANAIIEALDKHVGGDPKIKRLNEEISALLDVNKAAQQRLRVEREAGRPSEGSLKHAPQIIKDFAHGGLTGGLAKAGYRAAHAAWNNKDAAMAGIAKMARAGEHVTDEDIANAVKAGAKITSIQAIVNGQNDQP